MMIPSHHIQEPRRLALDGARVVLGLLGVLAAAPTVLAEFGRWWWFCELFAHFRMQYVVGLSAIGLAIVLFGSRRRWAIVPALALAWNFAILLPCWGEVPTGTAVGAATNVRTLRALSVNVHARNREFDRVFAEVRAESPDVLGILEVDPVWGRALETLADHYPQHRIHAEPRGMGVAFFSRFPATSIEVAYPGSRDAVIVARLEIGGEDVTVIVAHPLPPMGRSAARAHADQFRELAAIARAAAGPVVLLGDLNDSGWSHRFHRLLADSGLRDSRLGFGVGASWYVEFWPLAIPIDHALVSPTIEVIDRRIGGDVGSDHRAVIVDLRL